MTFLQIIGPRICGICIKSSIRKVKCNKLLRRLKWLLYYYSKKDIIDFGLFWWTSSQMKHPSILWVYVFLHDVTKPKPKSLTTYEMDIYYPWCWLIGIPSQYKVDLNICLEDSLQIVYSIHYFAKHHALSPKAWEKYGTMVGNEHVVILKKRQPKSSCHGKVPMEHGIYVI